MNPVLRASCGKSMMCLYETRRMIMSETMSQVKKSEKNTVRLKLVSPSRTPIDHDVLLNTREKTIVYDIIYDPPLTKLLESAQEMGLKTINGLNMNLVQAVLAFQYTNQTKLNQNKILEIMAT